MTRRKRVPLILLLAGPAFLIGAYQYLYWFTPWGAFGAYLLTGTPEVAGTIRLASIEDVDYLRLPVDGADHRAMLLITNDLS